MSYYNENKNKELIKIEEMLKSLPAFITRYVYAIQNKTTTTTQIAYLTDIKNFLEYFAGSKGCNVSDITPDDLDGCNRDFFDDYLNYLRHYEKDGKIYTNSIPSIKRKLSSIKNFMTYLYNNGLIKENAVTKVNNPKLRKKEITRLDAEEMTGLLNEIEYGTGYSSHKEAYHQKSKCRDLAITALILSTGIRISECVGINLTDVDLKKSSIRITRKGDKQDIVYFSDECSGYLAEYIEKRKQITALPGHEDALFLSSQRKRLTVRAIQLLIKNYARETTPLKHITPHKLRATFGTRLYEESGDIYLVAQALGHNSVDTSSKYYINASDTRKREARNLINLKENERPEL